MTLWHFVRWLHLISMGFFVGGQLFLAAVVVPSLRGNDDRGPIRTIARRFGMGTLVAIGVLIVTGVAMASHYHDWSDGDLHVKLALVGVVGVLVLAHKQRPQWHAIEGAIFLISLAIVWLGIAIAH